MTKVTALIVERNGVKGFVVPEMREPKRPLTYFFVTAGPSYEQQMEHYNAHLASLPMGELHESFEGLPVGSVVEGIVQPQTMGYTISWINCSMDNYNDTMKYFRRLLLVPVEEKAADTITLTREQVAAIFEAGMLRVDREEYIDKLFGK